MRFFLTFGFLALIIRCECLPMDILSGFSWPDDTSLAAALTRVKKNADGIDYLEECTFVDSWQEQPGFINVLAFLDASWEYSHRQATMLKMLQGRLERSGITGIKFFVINSSEPEAAANNLDVEDEKEAWDAAEPSQTHAVSDIQQTREALKNKIDPDIAFIQDSKVLNIWEKLSASRDQVIVIDKCGRLSYRVIVPWSILHFPYVKAAILSTYKEQPCGGCDFETTTTAQETESQTEPLSELLPENLNIKQMKEIAVKTYNLDETDNTVKKVYHGAESQDIPENVIQLLNGSASIKQETANANFNNSTKHGLLLSTGDSNFNDSHINRYSLALNSTEDNRDDSEHENHFVTEDPLGVNENTTGQLDGDSSSTIIYYGMDGIESTTVNTIEDESSNSRERTNHKVDNNESTVISTNLENTSKFEEVTENLDTDLYSIETSTPGNSYDIDTTIDSENLGISASLSEEESDNRINRTTVITSGEMNSDENSESTDYVMPIRIIMHAPHIHQYEEPMKKYEYLVLKLGKPEYHGHLESDSENEAGFEIDYNTGDENKNEENDEAEVENGEIVSDESRERNRHHGHGHEHRGRRKQSNGKNLHSIFDKDESPGFYGEDVEYWRNFGNGDYQGTLQIEPPNENIEYGKDKDKQAEVYQAVNITENMTNTTTMTATKNDTVLEEDTPRYPNSETNQEPSERTELTTDQQVDKSNTEENEKANHLFLHYSKLIPWLDYVFDQ